jgi:hypothetical protein
MSSPPPSPEDENRSSFRNVVFSRIPDDGKSPKTQQFCELLEVITKETEPLGDDSPVVGKMGFCRKPLRRYKLA